MSILSVRNLSKAFGGVHAVENVSFEETAYLLWEGKLPGRSGLDDLRKQLSASYKLRPSLELFGVVNNVFDKDPPVAPQNFGFPTINTLPGPSIFTVD